MTSLPILLQQKVTACQKCGECCRRYYISVLPDEVEKQSKFFKLSKEEFISIYCQLLVQVMPVQSGNHPLAVHSSRIPKNIWKGLQANGINSNYVLFLPMMGFKKEEYCVFFDPKLFLCTMHAVKPAQCSIYPFMAGEKNVDFAKAYEFCELARIATPTKYTNAQADIQKEKMAAYFESVATHGLTKVWPAIPTQGIILYQGKAIATIEANDAQKLLDNAREHVKTK